MRDEAGVAGPTRDTDARSILVVTYKFPDVLVPGGSVRLEKFVKYLPCFGWRPIVLTSQLPEACLVDPVHRMPDVHRVRSHYELFVKAYRTRYQSRNAPVRSVIVEIARRAKNWVLVPDDAVLWWRHALPAARALVRSHSPAAVLASGPLFSDLLLGLRIGRRHRIPFVADLRDDWAGNPLAGRRNWLQSLTEVPMERRVARGAAQMIHVTEASTALYRRRYPALADRMVCIPNGYDEDDLAAIPAKEFRKGQLLLVHTGTLKPSHPFSPLLAALARVRDEAPGEGGVRFRHVGPCHAEHRALVEAQGLAHQVQWIGLVPRPEVRRHLVEADALVLMPQRGAPTAVPGKAYEYLRAGRAILCISEPSEASRLLSAFEGVAVHGPDDVEGIARTLRAWRDAPPPTPAREEQIRAYSRRALTGRLAQLLDEVSSPGARDERATGSA